MRGIADYGRYDDDLKHVACPRAKSDMTPCIARDGHLALAGDPPRLCVGCERTPGSLLSELAKVYELAREPQDPEGLVPGGPGPVDPGLAADLLAVLVRRATDGLQQQAGG